MNCKHPHIFRIQTKDPYHCLACGEEIKVIPYSEVAKGSTSMVIIRKMPQAKFAGKVMSDVQLSRTKADILVYTCKCSFSTEEFAEFEQHLIACQIETGGDE